MSCGPLFAILEDFLCEAIRTVFERFQTQFAKKVRTLKIKLESKNKKVMVYAFRVCEEDNQYIR